MTPAQLNTLVKVHTIVNETDPKKRDRHTSGRNAMRVTAEHAPPVLAALASQRLIAK
jgi:hypothetical protein